MTRTLVVALVLSLGCSSSAPSTGDAAADTANPADALNSDAATGTCPEGQSACTPPAGSLDYCLTFVSPTAPGSESVLSCVSDPQMRRCALPPPCGVCARGGRLWRRTDLDAFNAVVATGMCPDYGDAGVPRSTIRQ